MKQTKFYLSIFFSISVFLFSCSKINNDIKPVQKSKYTTDDLFKFNKFKQYEPVYPSYTLVFDFYYVGHVTCWGQPTDCLGEVVVGGKKYGLKDTNFDQEKFKLYNSFKKLYNNNKIMLFFDNKDWESYKGNL